MAQVKLCMCDLTALRRILCRTALCSVFDSLCGRDRALKVIRDSFHVVSIPAKGGIVREALCGGYPRAATLLEEASAKLAKEAEHARAVKFGGKGRCDSCRARRIS